MKLRVNNLANNKKSQYLINTELRLVRSNCRYYIINSNNELMVNVESGNPDTVSSLDKDEVIFWLKNHFMTFGTFTGYRLNSNFEVVDNIKVIDTVTVEI